MSLSYREVAEILKIIDASDCEEVVLELEGMRLVVRRAGAEGATPPARPAAQSSAAAPAQAELPAAAAPQAAAPAVASAAPRAAQVPAQEGMVDVRAPMVGTFYRRPSPQDPPFVEVGDRIEKGQALCLIEVMKLFTTIEAQQAGTLELIGPEDGALVEFDQLLFRIRPA